MTLLNTVVSESFSLKGENLNFTSVQSPVLLVDLARSAPDVLGSIPASEATPETLGGFRVLAFASPSGGPDRERWYWAAPNANTLIIGGRAAVAQVLAITAGERPGLADRRVVRSILRDLEGASMIDLDLVPPAREASARAATGIGTIVESVPGASALFFAVRGQGSALEDLPDGGCLQKLDYQMAGRVSGAIFGGLFRFLSLGGPEAWNFSGEKGSTPEEVTIVRDAGLVAVHMRFGQARCREVKLSGERLPLFANDALATPRPRKPKRR